MAGSATTCGVSSRGISWNCGVEGPTQDEVVEQLRGRQIRNFLLLTLFATGTPMLLMGDEIRRSQRGNNNNAYCLDDESTWFDWSAIARHAELHGFTKRPIALRKARMLPLECDMTLNELIARHRIEWHGVTLGAPDWSHASHSLAATFHFDTARTAVHLMINAYWEALTFAVPPRDDGLLPWRCCVDTFRPGADCIRAWHEAATVRGESFVVQPRSIAVLVTGLSDRPQL